jgi:exodeoxyribonuclease V alpha subunit
MTVHKAQGSEFDTVALVLLSEHYVMLRRDVLYTGATRARRRLYLIGQKKALWLALKAEGKERATRLGERIAELVHARGGG